MASENKKKGGNPDWAKGPDGKGKSGNPGGQSREKRAFLERLRTEDADEIYEALMGLIREGNAPAILRAVEYIAGKPPDVLQVNARVSNPIAGMTPEQLLALATGRK